MFSNLKDNSLTLEGNRVIGTSNSLHTKEIYAVDNSLKSKIQLFAQKVQKDVQKALSKNFNIFDVFEYSASCNRLNETQYSMTIQIGEEDYISVKIGAQDPDETWTIIIEEYERQDKEQSNQPSKFEPCEVPSTCSSELAKIDREIKNEVQSIADYSKVGVELIVGQEFKVFEVIECVALSALGVHYYQLNIIVDNNNSVNIRLSHDITEKSWRIQVDEFNKQNLIEQERKKAKESEEIDEGSKNISAGEA